MPAEGLENPKSRAHLPRVPRNHFSFAADLTACPTFSTSSRNSAGSVHLGESRGRVRRISGSDDRRRSRADYRDAKHAPDTIIHELQAVDAPGANRFETADDLYDAISAAVKSREALKKSEQGQRVEGKQVSEFQRRAVQGDRPKNESGTYTRVPVGKMLEGDAFKVQSHSFTVKHLEFDQDGNLAFVEVKDGPKFGVQRVDGTEFIHIDKDSFEAGPEHGAAIPSELRRGTKQDVPDNRSMGTNRPNAPPIQLGAEPEAGQPKFKVGDKLMHEGKTKTVTRPSHNPKYVVLDGRMVSASETSPVKSELREDSTPYSLNETSSKLEALAQDVHGKSYAELEDWQQDAIRQAAAAGTLPRREQRRRVERREPDDTGGEPVETAADESKTRPVQPARTKAGAQDREALAQEVFHSSHENLFPESRDYIREQLESGRRAGSKLTDPIDIKLRSLQDERARLAGQINWSGTSSDSLGRMPSDRKGVGLLSQVRYIDGQIDTLRDIAQAPAELKANWFKKFLEGDEPDAVERTLDKLIAATDPLRPLKQGRLFEGTTQLPVWLTKTLLNNALKVVRTAYKGGKRIAEAVQEGVAWLRAQNIKGFDQDEAHVVLLKELQGQEAAPKSYGEITRRREEISKRLTEIGSEKLQPGSKPSAEARSERYRLAKESRDLEKQLTTNPDYVRDVYRRLEKLTDDLQIANKAGNGLHAREIVDELKSIMEAELPRIPQDLQKRIYDELVAKGEIMKSAMKELPAGRTLGDLTAWLKANGAESPKIPLRERLNLSRRLADEWNKGKDALTGAWARVAAGWQAFKQQYKAPPVDDDFRSTIKNWLFEKQWTGLETHKWVEQIRKEVPQPVRRAAMSVWLDAGGDVDVLKSQAEMVPARFRATWDAATKLTQKEQSLARRIQLDFEQKLSDGQGLGLLDRGRADYGVPQLWKLKPKFEGEYDPADPQWKKTRTPRNPTAKLDPRDPFFALQRTTPSYFDGIMAAGVPRSLDVGDLVGVYNTDFHNALADRGVIKNLKDSVSSDGKPVVMISGAAHIEPREAGARSYFVDSKWKPKDAVTADGRPYRAIDHWALKDWKFASTSEEGNPILVHGDFLVHPDHYQFLKNELGKSWLRDPEAGGKYFNPILTSTAFLKASKFASATFHMATLAEHSMFHAFAGAPSKERLSLLWPSTRGVELDPARNPQLAKLMQHGTELGFGAQRELFEEGLASHGGIWGKVPGLGDAMTKMSDFLFKRYMPALKVKTALAMLTANEARYKSKLSPEQIYELTSNQANAAFGAQNWRLLGTNKTMLDVNRLLFTAPDFLLSRAKVVGQALKPYNAEQRYFLLAQAALVYAGARVLNQLLDGNPHWESENALRVVYKGRAYTARFLVNDIANMVQDTPGFAAGRLGPVPRSGFEAVTGRDMRTGARKETVIETTNPAFRSAQILVQDLAQWLAPVGIEGVLPGAKGREQTAPGQVALALAGVGSRKYTAETQTYEEATKFNRRSPDAKAQLFQKTRDADAKTEGQYRKLDDLLDGDDLKGAQKEYEALIAEGHTPANMAARYRGIFRPFTGNAKREKDFKESLSPADRKIYDEAIQRRKERRDKFNQLRELVTESADAGAQ
jgi:hypothetical protein